MNEEWVDFLIEKLAEHEGTEGRKVAIEGGGSTRGYGITHIADGLKKFLSFNKLNADEMSDKDLARQIVLYNTEQMKNDIGEETWNSLPNSMKMIASDQYYNAGKLFPGFKRDLISGDYESALKNTLDIVLANDPKTGQKGILNGLINRRIDWYNIAAQELGINTINNFTVNDSSAEGKKTAINYNYSDGSSFVINSASGMHSASLKKTDTSLIDNQLKADAIRMDGSLPEILMNPNIDNQTKADIVKTETENTLGSGVVKSAENFVSNFVNDMQQINEQYKKDGKTELEKIQDEYNQKVEQTQINEAAFEKGKNEFVYANKDAIIKGLEKQNKEIEETDYLEGHKNPSFLDPMIDIPTISEQEQFQIDEVNKEAKRKLSEKYSYLDIAKASIDQEWITSWILKHNGREDLDPNYEFGINDFVLSKEQQDELKKDVNPDYWDAFDEAKSFAELKRIKEKILDVQEKEKIIMSKGIATGMTARFLAAVLDPTAIAAAIATDGLLAPAIVMNKANRIQRIIRGGLAAGTTNAAIEGALVSQNPTLGTKELLIAAAAGFVLGGSVRGFKSRNMSEDDIALNKAMDDYVAVKEKEIVEESGLKPTTKGNKKYDVANKTEQDDYDKIADEYNKDLADRTTIRTDGNTEIRMPDGNDEYIITKDGKIYKCD